MERIDILKLILSSGVLDRYRSEDKCLSDLINTAHSSLDSWRHRDDININGYMVSASEIERKFRIRLAHIPNEVDRWINNIRVATQSLVDYCATHREYSITAITFNCTNNSYDVFCGILNEKIETICVIVGKPIPPFALRNKPKD